jgi:hypothetical protein
VFVRSTSAIEPPPSSPRSATWIELRGGNTGLGRCRPAVNPERGAEF